LFYAAGGGGGTEGTGGFGAGGSGIGGRGYSNSDSQQATNGAVNRGAGGGGRPQTSGVGTAGAGGSGVVILRYQLLNNVLIGPGLTASTTIVGQNKVTIITAGTGTISIL
jgi:hypothetical protein